MKEGLRGHLRSVVPATHLVPPGPQDRFSHKAIFLGLAMFSLSEGQSHPWMATDAFVDIKKHKLAR